MPIQHSCENTRRRFRLLRRALPFYLLSLLAGCVSPMALDRLALAYNEATADAISRQLLLNIARARHHHPIHFSGISNIAATLNFQANIGVTPPLTGDTATTLMPILGLGASENPTISIVPMSGEEFTLRLLTPLSGEKLTLLLRQNVDIDLLLRIVGLEFRAQEQGRDVVYHNHPDNRDDYAMFRRVVLHLSSIQDRDELYAEPLIFDRQWTLPVSWVTAQGFPDVVRDYRIERAPKDASYRLTRQLTGRVILSNYDPQTLPNEERTRLNDEAERSSDNDLLIDIRPGHPGGEYPLHGRLRLRSFSNILDFIGRSMGIEPEYPVAKDARTPNVSENPTYAIAVAATRKPPEKGLSVEYEGLYYFVQPDEKYPWNATAFRLLSQIFQMTMMEPPRVGVPSITIAK